MEIIATSEDKRYRVCLEIDEDSSNPREEYDQIVYAVTVPNSRCDDIAEAGPLVDGWDRIKDRPDAVELFERWARIFHGAVALYDTPHEGPSAVWYIMPDGIKEVGDPKAVLAAIRDEYRSWASGDVYGYVIEEAVDWRRADGRDGDKSTWEVVNDCWGLVGYEYAEKEARREFAEFLKDKRATN